MKTFYALVTALLFSLEIIAQVDVTATGGNLSASYPTLKEALDQVNLGTHTGAINIGISGNTTETASAVINASGAGAASYVFIVIRPTGSAARTISGNIAGPLIDLNGADSVTIDGLNTGGNSLTISNTNTGSTASTIQLIQDASSNMITRCNVRGSTGAAGTTGIGTGVIYFAYGTAPVTGCDNNTISNNTIGPAGTNLPVRGIYSLGVVGSGPFSDNNSILNNNIFDYFSPYENSYGVYLLSSNGNWTISGNHFYQTATRTPINNRTHFGISVVTGKGLTINNNFIGGSSPSALGAPYTFAGTASTRFVGITMSADNLPVNNIQGNTIANISLNTSAFSDIGTGIWCGIEIFSGSANVGTTAANTIGATSGTDNIRVVSTGSGGLVVGMSIGATGAIAIQNNTMGAISFTGSGSTIAGHLAGINFADGSSSLTVSGNTIGNVTADNMRSGTNGTTTGASMVSGITSPGTQYGTVAIANNTIRNLSAYGTGNGFVRGIWTGPVFNSSVVFSVTGNTISALTTSAAPISGIFAQSSAIGIYVSAGTNNLVSQNTLHTIANINPTTTGTYVMGILTATGTNTTISRNRIYNLANAGTSATTTSPSVAAGIVVQNGTTAVNIFNNMISLGNGQTTNTAFMGIQCQNGITPNPLSRIYYNSIHIEGTAVAGAQPSFGIARTDFSTTARTAPVDIKNNIVNNTRSGGTGGHFAIGNNYGALTATTAGWGANASNYNLLNANAATIGNWGGTSRLSFASWRGTSAGDSSSLTAKPVSFVNTITGNLRLNFGTTPTSIESAGTVLANVTTDFDNDARPGPTGAVNGGSFAPDLGADEFDGVYLDGVPPVITYAPLGNTCDTGSRSLVVAITDFNGAPLSGLGLPRLYWRVNAGAYTGVAATSLGNNQYRFVFGNGALLGDVISYYVVAQDTAATPNVTAAPAAGATGFTANPPAAATPPTAPNSYTIIPVLPAGIYSIGTGGNYTTVGAAINAYNNSCLVGPVVFEIRNGTYFEAAGWIIRKHPDASAVNTLTIRPAAGASPYIGGNVGGGPSLKILGSYVTVDGSNNGGQSRDLIIGNSSTTGPIAIVIGSTGTSPITNVTIKNCHITTSAYTNPAVVMSDGAVYNDSGYFNNISFVNNRVYFANVGLHINAVPQPGNGNNIAIRNNLMNVGGFDQLRYGGIFMKGVDGATVSGNSIGNFETATLESDFGISLVNCSNTALLRNNISNLNFSPTSGAAAPVGILVTANIPSTGIAITGNTITGLNSNGGTTGVSTRGIAVTNNVTGVTIGQNSISQISNGNTAGWAAHGILLASTSTAANITVVNNFIANVFAYGFSSTGIDDNGYGIAINAGAGYQLYHNTVNLATGQSLASGFPSAFYVSAAITTNGAIDLRNNIFCNRQTNVSTQRFAIISKASSSVMAAIDYNDYYSTGPNLGYFGTSNQSNLAALQASFGGNANSINALPSFISNTDLRINTNENSGLDNKGVPIVSVPLDIDSNARSNTTPDIGASEFAFLGYCANINVGFVSNLVGSSYQWQVDTGSGYADIANGGVYGGATTATLTLINPPTSYVGYKYRCVVDGTGIGAENVYKVGANWTGASSTDWTDSGNWGCGIVPDRYTHVQINKDVPNYPVINLPVTIKSLLLQLGAAITIAAGGVLNM